MGKIIFDKNGHKSSKILTALILPLILLLLLIIFGLIFKDYTKVVAEPRIPEGLLMEVKRFFK